MVRLICGTQYIQSGYCPTSGSTYLYLPLSGIAHTCLHALPLVRKTTHNDTNLACSYMHTLRNTYIQQAVQAKTYCHQIKALRFGGWRYPSTPPSHKAPYKCGVDCRPWWAWRHRYRLAVGVRWGHQTRLGLND
jgi:hypothetical protein